MRVAAAQYCASNDILQNQDTIARLISQASSQSVSLICFPECANLIAKNKKELQEKAEPADNSDTLKRIKTLAQKYNIIISLGSLLLRQSDSKKILNRSFLVDINGECIATYDKIHMFDANVGDGKIYLINAKQYTETALGLLNKNQFEFIKFPKFKKNIIPYK